MDGPERTLLAAARTKKVVTAQERITIPFDELKVGGGRFRTNENE